MRFIAYVSGPASIVLFSQAESIAASGHLPTGADYIMQGGALGLMGWAFWYLLCRRLPAEQKNFREMIKEERDLFRESLKDLSDDSSGIRRELGQLREQCKAAQAKSKT